MSDRTTLSVVSKESQLERKRKRSKAAPKRQEKNVGEIRQLDSDISADEADESMPIKRKRVSLVHSYATKVSKYAYKCNLCSKIIRCGIDTNANIRRHLANIHGLTHLKSNSHVLRHVKNIDPVRKNIYDAAAINAIIVDGRSFSDFRRKGMADFLSIIAPGYFGPHERTVQRAMKHLYGSKLLELQQELKHIDWVSLTTDLWRRPKKHHYLCVTVHFVDQNYRNISKVLSFQRFHGRHFAKRIRNHLSRVVKRYDLQSKIVATVSDNGGDMRAATQQRQTFGIRLYCAAHGLNLTVKNGLGLWKRKKEKEKLNKNSNELLSSLSEREENKEEGHDSDDDDDDDEEEEDESEVKEKVVEQATETNVVPSNTINSNLDGQEIELDNEELYELPKDDADVMSSDEEIDEDIVQLPKQNVLIEHIHLILIKCRKLVNIINKSSIFYETIQTLARPKVKVDLVIDMIVRWNSTYTMISHLLLYRPILSRFIDDISSNMDIPAKKQNLLVKLQPSEEEWEILNTLSECLSLFADASEMLSGSNYPSFALTYPVLDSLQHYLNSNSKSHMEAIIKGALSEQYEFYMKHSINTEENKLLLMCAYLDPTSHVLMKEHDKILATELLSVEWNKIKDLDINTNVNNSYSINTDSSTHITGDAVVTKASAVQKLKLFRKKCGITDETTTAMMNRNLILKQEFSSFEAYDKDNLTFSSFWQKYHSSLPILSKMAIRYGGIPGTSVPSESTFSIAGHVARKTRSSLTAKNLKYSIFLKDKI